MHNGPDSSLAGALARLGPYYDLVLVEGYKTTALEPRVWLCGAAGEDPPADVSPVTRVLKRHEDRARIVMDMIDAWLPRAWRAPPIWAGILFGGRSSRFGQPKHLVRDHGKTWLEHTVEAVGPHVAGIALLGAGAVPDGLRSLPVLCDAPDTEGPLAGMLAAMRWRPLTSWVFVPCDLPLLSSEAVRWLIDARAPGTWAVLPRLAGRPCPEPLLAYYDFRAAPMLERVRRPIDIATEARVATPPVPEHIRTSWQNVNTPEEWAKAK